MIFRYDFGSNLDLSKFKKQSAHYIGRIPNISYHLFLSNYKIIAEINKIDDGSLIQINSLSDSIPNNLHTTTISIYDIIRDNDGEISKSDVVVPLNDIRFKELKQIIEIFPTDHYKGSFASSTSQNTCDKICKIVNILTKIDKLKAFL